MDEIDRQEYLRYGSVIIITLAIIIAFTFYSTIAHKNYSHKKMRQIVTKDILKENGIKFDKNQDYLLEIHILIKEGL